MSPDKIGTAPVRLSLHALRPAERTVWLICEAEDADGRRGFGEATLNGREVEVARHFLDYAEAILGGRRMDGERTQADTIAEAAAGSSIDQALTDLKARTEGVSISGLLALGEPDSVTLYANVNRGTKRRTAEGFAEQARAAVADGYGAVKIAPFDPQPIDSLLKSERERMDFADSTAVAIERMRATRAAVGPKTELLVDCHWLLREEAAYRLRETASDLGIRYIECPIPEDGDNLPAVARLRRHYNEASIALAGGELLFDARELDRIIDLKAMDIVMPDVKYVPSLHMFAEFLHAAAAGGVKPAPHNPSGPVAHAFSWQISGAVAAVEQLEIQYRESPLFCMLVGRDADFSESAWNERMSRGPGIGFEPQLKQLHEYHIGAITIGRDLRHADGIFAGLECPRTAPVQVGAEHD